MLKPVLRCLQVYLSRICHVMLLKLIALYLRRQRNTLTPSVARMNKSLFMNICHHVSSTAISQIYSKLTQITLLATIQRIALMIKRLLLKPGPKTQTLDQGPGPWTRTLRNLDSERPGPWKILTLKKLDPEKHGKRLDMEKWLEDHIAQLDNTENLLKKDL